MNRMPILDAGFIKMVGRYYIARRKRDRYEVWYNGSRAGNELVAVLSSKSHAVKHARSLCMKRMGVYEPRLCPSCGKDYCICHIKR